MKERWGEPVFWIASLCAVLTVIGAVGPWAKAKPPPPPPGAPPLPIQIPGSITVGNGTDVGVGWAIIALTVIAFAGLLAFRLWNFRWGPLGSAIAAAVACAIAVYARINLRERAFSELPPLSRIIHPGWGISLTIAASAALALASLAVFFIGRSQPLPRVVAEPPAAA